MISCYAKNGFVEDVVLLLESMKKKGIKLKDSTMVSVLIACNYTSLVERAIKYFKSMNRDYGIIPNIKYYMCIVDLFGQAGCLYETHNVIKNIPIKPEASTWIAVLSACRIHDNLELGEKVAKIIFEVEPSNSVPYKLLVDLYAVSGR
ncbi:hypothetical protein Patl1_33541 [Pistacia atlantica]|uniref:Uncharacterized protein n=1 Tax=Pistacia atlantica TaxID=434234 RepID=A0ACC0ZRQ8_9ROSI|nr:hypothetical protein Patl1_33541 [Pistacia atlantica]